MVRVNIVCKSNLTLEEFKDRIYSDGNYTEDNLPEHRNDYLQAIKFAKKYFKIKIKINKKSCLNHR
ncbi:hypothetical protein [Campylobacter insulaenigrae]|uniref:hypothetical protein n=1 Tax=Campylobacter insulaenigrae TaxID=260714 RepID=UPI0021533413|nr:hypothetical protein [Campylobacter insulaenigrae]MCR6574328.1 hypothetical protein [Campylobacter insulaenigrae]